MAEIDVNAYATTAANASAALPNIVETQQPGGTGALRQVMSLGDPTVRANIQKITTAGQALVATPDVAITGTMAALNAAVTTAVNSQGIVAIQLTGTWVGTVTFQGTEDPAGIAATTTSWFNVNGVASVSGAQVTSTTANGQFRVNAGGYTAVRAIMTAFTSGSATAWLNASLAPSMATLAEPLPAGTNIIGSVIVTDGVTPTSNLAGDTGQNAQLTAGIRKETTFSLAAAGNTTAIDVSNYRAVSVHITAIYTGQTSYTWQGSNDNVNWVGVLLIDSVSLSAAGVLNGTAAAKIYYGPLNYRYFRIVAAGAASALAFTGTIEIFSQPNQLLTIGSSASQSGTWSVGANSATGSAIPANAFLLGGNLGGNLAAISALNSPTNQGVVNGLMTYSHMMMYNGATVDTARNNWNTTTGDTGAKTASFAGATQTNYNATGATIVINMGAVTGTTPTLTAQMQGSADSGTTWYNIPGAITPSITTTGVSILTVYPGATVAANAAISYPLPRTWRLNYTIGGTVPSFTITNIQVAYTL